MVSNRPSPSLRVVREPRAKDLLIEALNHLPNLRGSKEQIMHMVKMINPQADKHVNPALCRTLEQALSKHLEMLPRAVHLTAEGLKFASKPAPSGEEQQRIYQIIGHIARLPGQACELADLKKFGHANTVQRLISRRNDLF